jgi:hypothetical protein
MRESQQWLFGLRLVRRVFEDAIQTKIVQNTLADILIKEKCASQ